MNKQKKGEICAKCGDVITMDDGLCQNCYCVDCGEELECGWCPDCCWDIDEEVDDD